MRCSLCGAQPRGPYRRGSDLLPDPVRLQGQKVLWVEEDSYQVRYAIG